jgi:FMN phosphatase YigB (HAD superfamily)
MFKYLLLALLVLCAFKKYQQIQVRKQFIARAQAHTLTPENTLFAFDLHSTVLTADKRRIINILWHALPQLPISIYFRLISWDLAFKLSTGNFMIKQALLKLAEQYPREAHIIERMSVDIMNAYILTPEMHNLLQELKAKKYTLYIASSIWQEGYDKLLKQYPVLQTLFSGIYISNSENQYVHKPEAAYYQLFTEYLQKQHQDTKYIIFIDNSFRNIKAAPPSWFSYKFINTARLHQTLKNIGILD